MTDKLDVQAIKKKAEAVLDKIRPSLHMDGGDAKLVELKPDGTLVIEFMGACHGCPMSAMTLKQGIERIVRQEIPEVVSVEAVVKGF